MDNLPGTLVYLCAAIFVPIALARYAVRADWRTVRYACLFWYGFLLLGFGAFQSSEGFGWALIFAMFFSIPALPILALLMRGWKWLGTTTVASGVTGPTRTWSRRFPFSLVSARQFAVVAALVAGYFLVTHWYEQRDLNSRADYLRKFLQLPADKSFSAIQSMNSAATAPRLAARMQFTEREFNTFAAQHDALGLWRNGLPHYDGAAVEVVLPEEIKWRDAPVPLQVGETFVNWTRLSAEDIRSLRRGRALCIALQQKPGSHRFPQSDEVTPRFSAQDCSTVAKTGRVTVIVLGVLDLDTGTLHMIIN